MERKLCGLKVLVFDISVVFWLLEMNISIEC